MRIDGTAYLTIRPDGGGIAALYAFYVTPAHCVTGLPALFPKRS